jgi:GT2 family glycosyltransferase
MPDLELSVTICSWNTKDDLEACLASLEAARGEAEFEVIVIDNNSEDGSPDMVEALFPTVRLYRMSQNLGFTGGHNFALEERKGPHAFLLNSDATVHPGALRGLLDFVSANPQAGIIGPKVLNPDGSLQLSCRRFPNPLAALFRNTIVGRIFPKNRFTREYLMLDWKHDGPREVDWVSGCAFLATAEVIEKVGTLDPEYFMFCEDVDWCFRTWKAGFKVMYVPDATVTHAIGRSTDKAPNRMIGRFHGSMLRFYRKNMVPQLPAPVRPFALAGAAFALGVRASLFIAQNKVDKIKRSLRK